MSRIEDRILGPKCCICGKRFKVGVSMPTKDGRMANVCHACVYRIGEADDGEKRKLLEKMEENAEDV